MDAGDIIRMRKAQATLAGFNSVLAKQGLPASEASGNDCCGYFDSSSCSFPSPISPYTSSTKLRYPNPSNDHPASPVVYGTYEYRQLVQEGLVVNGCIPTKIVQMQVQPPLICPSVIVTIPVNGAPQLTFPM
jgi:hypothetical protein